MKVREVAPDIDTGALLSGAQFADAFRIETQREIRDARQAAERMTERSPRWIEVLMSLRNLLVAPFGLKTSGEGEWPSREMIGIFPVLRETPDRLVAGFNDKHLDFRLVVDVASSGSGQHVTATTLVRTHNRLGRVYLAIILPFHRLIVAAMLQKAAA
ncbi:DUF2867 domain-containing protein [Bradyrhizobium sp. dw_78]|uniref:DUF2867 domain-containing protein n=1 Tax=Bradyrhizobium sp. dw_78 TaxID=2719793 RepID=UPI001BD2D393|nr:DUF2867 domain-containing protein [Bradyrhizobium sp. dw_78]